MFSTSLATMHLNSILELALLHISPNHLTILSSIIKEIFQISRIPLDNSEGQPVIYEPCDAYGPAELQDYILHSAPPTNYFTF